jgi:crotonobetainyl-CoA:carnitine CoA-transferase CaiB-like acyl-CoA transferase
MVSPSSGTSVRGSTTSTETPSAASASAAASAWCSMIRDVTTVTSVPARLDAAEVPCGAVDSVRDLDHDPQVRARENIVEFPSPLGGLLAMGGIVPKLSVTPGRVESLGPVTPGAHNEEIHCGRRGLSRDDLAALRQKGVV